MTVLCTQKYQPLFLPLLLLLPLVDEQSHTANKSWIFTRQARDRELNWLELVLRATQTGQTSDLIWSSLGMASANYDRAPSLPQVPFQHYWRRPRPTMECCVGHKLQAAPEMEHLNGAQTRAQHNATIIAVLGAASERMSATISFYIQNMTARVSRSTHWTELPLHWSTDYLIFSVLSPAQLLNTVFVCVAAAGWVLSPTEHWTLWRSLFDRPARRLMTDGCLPETEWMTIDPPIYLGLGGTELKLPDY